MPFFNYFDGLVFFMLFACELIVLYEKRTE
jgi:hypothetical protein